MEYSIQQLAQLAGVSTRTLRWYHSIGLLKPSRVADSGYRYYGPAEVDRLQDILYYRALGVELARIREILDAPSFDRLTALRGHLAQLEYRRRNIQELIDSVKATILSEERNESMSDEAKFQAFKRSSVEENEKTYGNEIREKYGDEEVDRANETFMGLTREQYREWEGLGKEILEKLSRAVAGGQDPAGPAGEELTRLHRRWLTLTWGKYDPARHRGVVQLYVQDPRFTDYYDGDTPGCARFLCDAVTWWADRL